MKKIILLIAVIALVAVLSFSLVACNNATVQGQLEDIWRPYEQYVYKVTDVDGTIGTYTVTIEEYLNGSVNCGNTTLSDVKHGYLITGKLLIGNADYDTACYFNLIDSSNYLVPVASYRKQVVDSATTIEITGRYDGAKYNYSGIVNGADKNGTIDVNSPYYDNNEFQQVLRGASSMSSSFSFSFNIPGVSEKETGAFEISATVTGEEDITVPVKDSSIGCYKVGLSRATKVSGVTQTLYYSKDTLTVDSNKDGAVDNKDWPLTRVLVKIVEPTAGGEVIYELQSASTQKPTV